MSLPESAALLSRLADADVSAGKLVVGAEFPLRTERRRHVRVRTDQPVRVRVLGAIADEFDARIADVSADGVCVRTPDPLCAGAGLLMQYRGGYLLGTVRNCRRLGAGYAVGVELERLGSNTSLVSFIRAAERQSATERVTRRRVGHAPITLSA